ncbi:hypothetical protein ACTFIW_008029 [Dictyostelium discoideum]
MPSLFSSLKFFCFSPTKDTSDKKIKDEILKKIEVNGGTVQYCIQKFSTNYIILCNGLDEYDRDQHYYNFQSNSLDIPILSYKFINDCIDKNLIINDLQGYKISNIIDETIIRFEYQEPEVQEEIKEIQEIQEAYDDFFDLFGLDSAPIADGDVFKNMPPISEVLAEKAKEEKENQENQEKERQEKEKEKQKKEKSKFKSTYISDRKLAMNQKTSSPTTTTSYFDNDNNNDDHFDIDEIDFNLFSNIDLEIDEKPIEEDFNLFNIGHYDDNVNRGIKTKSKFDSLNNKIKNNGYIFQFVNKDVSLYHEKDFPNNFKSIKLFKQSPKGLSCMITEDNRCYIWGNIKSNQKVEQLEDHYQVDYCSVGASHSVMIKRGIHTVGLNKFGQLGNKNENNNCSGGGNNNKSMIENQIQRSISIINQNFLKKVLMVSCGKDFNVLLTNEGQVFSWGKNDLGQLGLGNSNGKENYEIKLVNFDDPYDSKSNKFISFISCGENHSIAIESNSSTDGNCRLYGWGSNSQGQIGEKYSSIPMLIKNQDQKSFNWKSPLVICTQDTTIVIEAPLKCTTFGVKFNSFLMNLKENFQDLTQFNIVVLKKKIGVLVYDEYIKASFLLKSLNYNENYHYQLIKLIIESNRFQHSHAVKLAKDCCEYGNLKVFKLLEHKFPLNLIDPVTLESPIHYSTLFSNNHLKSKIILEYCLNNKIYSIDQLNNQKETPLHYCSRFGNYEIATILLVRGCNRNLKDAQGQTPLHISVSQTNHQLSSLLCKHGAQSIPDKTMKNPLQYCSADIKSNLQNILFTNEVFISYAHKDSEFVNNLRSNFGLFSLRCWLDEYRLQAGCNWRAEITRGVVNSDVVVFVISETSINSLWCRKELKMSKKLGKVIIPIFLQSVQIDPILYGLFTFIPKTTKKTFKEMSEKELVSNVSSISNLIHSILNGTQESKLLTIQQQQQQNFEKSVQSLSRKQFFDRCYLNDKNSGCYLLFNNADRILFDFICDKFKENSIPTISSDEIIGRPSDQDDQFSLFNLMKQKKENSIQRKKNIELEKKLKLENDEKLKQQWKIKRKIEKKLEKSKLIPSDPNYQYLENYLIQLYNFKNDNENEINENENENNNNQNNIIQNNYFNNDNNNNNYYDDNDIPILNNNFNSSELNNNYFSSSSTIQIEDSYDNNNNNNNNQAIYYDDGKTSEEEFYKQLLIEKENEKYHSIQPLKEFIKNSLLMCILFTRKTTKTEIEKYCLQIEYAKSFKDEKGNQDKTIIVITPDLSLKDNQNTPSVIKDLVWYEIDSKNIDLIFENITLMYEVLEKTLQISNLVNNNK